MTDTHEPQPEDTVFRADSAAIAGPLIDLMDRLNDTLDALELDPQSDAQIRAVRQARQGLADLVAAFTVDPARHRFVTFNPLTGDFWPQVFTYVQPLQWQTPDGGVYHLSEQGEVETFVGGFVPTDAETL